LDPNSVFKIEINAGLAYFSLFKFTLDSPFAYLLRIMIYLLQFFYHHAKVFLLNFETKKKQYEFTKADLNNELNYSTREQYL